MPRHTKPVRGYQLTAGQYAEIYGCSEPAARKYGQAGAPLDAPAAMFDWLWINRSRPAEFESRSRKQVVEAYESEQPGSDEKEARERLTACIATVASFVLYLRDKKPRNWRSMDAILCRWLGNMDELRRLAGVDDNLAELASKFENASTATAAA